MPEDIVIDPEMEQRGEPLPPVTPQVPQPAPQVVPQQLTPMQQRFLTQLGQNPQASAVYQPAQSFDDPAYQQKLYEWEQETRRTAEAARAEQAIQSGIRYIYQRRYDQDLKNGVPESTAFSRMMLGIAMHAPKTDPIKAFQAFSQPPPPAITNVGGVNVLRSGRYGERATVVQPPLGTGPLQGVPVLNPDGTTNSQYFAVPGATGKGFTTHPNRPETPTASLSLQDRQLRDKITKRQKALDELDKNIPEEAAKMKLLQGEIDAFEAQRDALTTPKAKQSPVAKQLTRELAVDFLKQAGGDKEKARKLARDAGYGF